MCAGVQVFLTFLEEDVCDGSPAQRAGGVGGAVLGKGPKTRLTEDVVTGLTHVGAEIHIQTHSADTALPLPPRTLLTIIIFFTAAAGVTWGTLQRDM